MVECPRCNRQVSSSGVWLWCGGQAEPLAVEGGQIVVRNNGSIDLFDLPCGCVFDTRLWDLRVRSRMSVRQGVSVEVYVAAKYVLPGQEN